MVVKRLLLHIEIEMKSATSIFDRENVPWHTGIGLSQTPGGLLPGALHVTVEDPFKRYPTAQEKLHSEP